MVLVPINAVKDFVVTLDYSPTGFLLGVCTVDLLLSLVAGYFCFFLYKSLKTSKLLFADSGSERPLVAGPFGGDHYVPRDPLIRHESDLSQESAMALYQSSPDDDNFQSAM
eukprot:g851.t1